MSAHNPWSGLAPAVDIHLERWKETERAMPMVQVAQDGYPAKAIARALTNEWIRRWMLFATSYGVLDDNGKPLASIGIMDGSTISGREQLSAEEAAIGQGLHLCEREHRMLANAVTHYVSAEVLDEVDEAAGLAEYEPLFHTDLIVPNGFAVFERPVIFPDLDPDSGMPHPTIKVWVRAMGWCTETTIWSEKYQRMGSGVSIFLYTTHDDYNDGFLVTLKATGRTPPFEGDEVADGLLPMEVVPWCFGTEWGARDELGYRPGTVPTPVAMERRWFLAFQRLCWQEIVVRHPQRTTRQETRRWERFRKPLLEYTVLRLRREVDPNYVTPGGGISLDHRVRVRGHWRRQHYPSLGYARNADGTMNPESHRLIWIEAFWKGPEDGPLGPLHSATSVVR